MSDDPSKRGPRDRNRIALDQPHEVRYWTGKFEVSESELAAAVKEAGNSADAVQEYFSTRRGEGGIAGFVKSAIDAVTGGGEEDALTLLKRDHREVDALFKRFEELENGRRADRARIVEEICALLTVHATVEEELFYPAVRARVKEAADLLDEARVEHGSVKEFVARLQGMQPDQELYKANVTVLKEYVQHHVKEEEGELFGLVKSSDLDLDELGRRLEERKLELITLAAAGGTGS